MTQDDDLIDILNNLSDNDFESVIYKCCSSHQFAKLTTDQRPFSSIRELFDKTENIWFQLKASDWLEAISHHPKIGDVETLKKKYNNSNQSFESQEQANINLANLKTIEELAYYNEIYVNKFNFIFLINATGQLFDISILISYTSFDEGKTAEEMLIAMKERYNNDYDNEVIPIIVNLSISHDVIACSY